MRVCVVILNWNGWADTIACLESVFRLEHAPATVVVCDNASSDDSLSHVKRWAEGRLAAPAASNPHLCALTNPPVAKPIRCVELSREQAERGAGATPLAPLVLVRTGANLGFAGGVNVGLRWVLARGEWDSVWLLNNDTLVRPDALTHLVQESERMRHRAMVGSTLLHYDAPEVVQALGGCTFNRWLALARPLGAGRPAGALPDASAVRGRMAYVAGASLLLPVTLLREVGLLSEEYFLYFEEIDLTLRARGRYRVAYAPASVVYHREGKSTGAGRRPAGKSWAADYYHQRGRILVTRKFAPLALPTVYFGLLVALVRRLARGQWGRVGMIARLIRST